MPRKRMMKSTKKQLENRGYVPEEALINYKDISADELVELLNSHKATERTAAAKIAGGGRSKKLLPLLCTVLANEKKLYTKIALSEAIAGYGVSCLKYLIPLLGKIGNNQHRKIALVVIKKKSYPLPRDMAARIVVRIGESALPFLEKILVFGTYAQKLKPLMRLDISLFIPSNIEVKDPCMPC